MLRTRGFACLSILAVLAACLSTVAAAGEAPATGAAAGAAPATTAGAAVEPGTDAEATAELAPGIDLSDYAPSWGQREFLGFKVWQFIAVFLLILLGLVLRKVVDYVARNKVIPLLKRSPFQFDHLIAEAAAPPAGWLLFIFGLYLALGVLSGSLSPRIALFAFSVVKVLIAADVLWFLFRLVDVSDHYLLKLTSKTESTLDDQLVPVIRKALKATIGVLGFVWVVEWLGGNISSLLAGLGIGGLAVALALQDTLANFFGSVFIFLDRPFVIGDWVKIEDVEGVVEEIGFRSTRIRTLPKTLVSIPNKKVADSTINNMTRMPQRRVKHTVGLTYETTADQMEQAVAAIREICEKDPGVHDEGIIVRFTEFGASSLDILVCYFTTAIPTAEHLETSERVNLAIMRAVADLGLEIAFPTQTVYFEGDVAKAMAGRLDRDA